MTDLVFDVTYAHGETQYYVRGLTGAEAAMFKRYIPDILVKPRKLLPCAQRPSARIATLPPAGTTPANPAGGGDL